MRRPKYLLLLLLICQTSSANKTKAKNGKMFSFFNVVEFPNDICRGTDGRSGVCYTAEKCGQRGGTSGGQCAQGFGVCCIIRLNCGGTSSNNVTHLTLVAGALPPSTCNYEICPVVGNICRMKLEFSMFEIAQPEKFSVFNNGQSPVRNAGVLGDCTSDMFSIATQGGVGTPVICGYNTNQHVFVDVSNDCITASFSFGLTPPMQPRKYDIQVLQFLCGSEMAGPPGCLQFFTAPTGSIASFNFPTNEQTLTGIGRTAKNPTHLSGQNYNICFRRGVGQCAVCFQPTIRVGAPQSFGLSKHNEPNGNPGKSAIDASCKTDYLVIPDATNDPVQAANQNVVIAGVQRLCGRFFNTASATISVEICTGTTPFQVGFVTDQNEAPTSGLDEKNKIVLKETNDHELQTEPGGIVGFQLDYRQVAC